MLRNALRADVFSPFLFPRTVLHDALTLLSILAEKARFVDVAETVESKDGPWGCLLAILTGYFDRFEPDITALMQPI